VNCLVWSEEEPGLLFFEEDDDEESLLLKKDEKAEREEGVDVKVRERIGKVDRVRRIAVLGPNELLVIYKTYQALESHIHLLS
jgi:hypothetical protein